MEKDMQSGNDMRAKKASATAMNILLALVLIGLLVAPSLPAASEDGQEGTTTPAPGGKGFATPKAAADTFIAAAADYDRSKLEEILGPKSAAILTIADPVEAKNRAAEFAAAAKEKNSLKTDPKNSNRTILLIGNDDWPFPIPIVKRGTEWYFDTGVGLNEILARRIGADELDAITVCRGYVEAQLEYATQIHDDSGLKQYAQKIISTPGKQDGLAWKKADGTWGGPVGEAVANAIEQGYSGSGRQEPYHGYYFKVLKGQGPAAPLGRLDYVIQGVMIGGFAMVAAPAEYGATGVQTFIVSSNGIVYQKDLGPDTLKIVKDMDRYDPDKTWKRTDDDW